MVRGGLRRGFLLHPDPAGAAGGLRPLMERVLGGQDGDREPEGLVRRSVTRVTAAAFYVPGTQLLTLFLPPWSSVARRHHLQLYPVLHRHRALLRLLHHAWRLLHQQVLHQLQHVVLRGGLHHLGAAQSAGAIGAPAVHLFYCEINDAALILFIPVFGPGVSAALRSAAVLHHHPVHHVFDLVGHEQ